MGIYHRTSSVDFWRIEELGPDLHLVEYDLTDLGATIRLFSKSGVTEIHSLAVQGFVGAPSERPATTTL